MSFQRNFEDCLRAFSNRETILTVFAYEEMSKNGVSNFVISPISAEHILALAYVGARGETADQLRFALAFFPKCQHKIEEGFKTFTELLQQKVPQLKLWQSVFVKNTYKIRADFKQIANDAFKASVESIDFDNSAESLTTINEHVKQQSEGKIENILKSENVKEDSCSILTNVVFFKSNWKFEFERYLTCQRAFYLDFNQQVQVETMMTSFTFNVYESKKLDAKLIELPFKNRHCCMIIIYPRKIEGLQAIEDNIDLILKTDHVFGKEYVKLCLPKFTINNKINFREILQKHLGVEKAFAEKQADFSGIAGEPGELHINDVIQNIIINIDERGINIDEPLSTSEECSDFPVPIAKEFPIEHPFIFYIKVKDVIAFVGKVLDPRPSEKVEETLQS